ncbi:MAG: ECF transporter S component [Ruminococcus sp.]|nr:ECF transporter S component [Ruminococcus sp.]
MMKNRTLRIMLKWGIPLLLAPALVLLGAVVFQEKQHLFISFMAAILAVLLFFTGFERKQVGTRRMVIVAVMTALCIAGRFIPFFKPVTAITVIAAVYLGRESGFLVGAMAALLSNFYFGQGPWTAFQMLSWGLIGWFAGLFADPLKRHRALLLLYGVLSGIAYSLLMDVWTVMSFHGQFTLPLYLAAAATSMPHMLLYAVSNFLFLWWMAKPFGDKLERIRIKYGI